MSGEMKKIISAAAKSSVTIITRAVGFGLMGLFLNILILVLLRPEMSSLLDRAGSMPLHGPGGPGAFVIVGLYLLAIWPVTLMAAGFGILLPLVWFLMGKKHGVATALHALVSENHELIMSYLVDRLWQRVAAASGARERGNRLIAKSEVLQILPAFCARLDTMPRPLRAAARILIERIDFGGLVTRIIEEQQMSGDAIDFDQLSRIVIDRTAVAVEERILAPDLKWLAILAAVNGVVAVSLKLLL